VRRDQVDFDESTNQNEAHHWYGKTVYHASMRRPFPKGTDEQGATLGRSIVSHDAAYEDLRQRVKDSTGVDIGPLRDINEKDLFLAVNRMFTRDADRGDALDEVRDIHGKLVEQRRQAYEAQEARDAKVRQVWMRRTVTEYTMVEIDEYDDLNDAMETARLNSDHAPAGWECIEESEPWVTEVTTTDGTTVWSPPEDGEIETCLENGDEGCAPGPGCEPCVRYKEAKASGRL
jgi:hypothetical protein